MADADRDLRPIDRGRARDIKTGRRGTRDLDVARDAGQEVGTVGEQRLACGDGQIDREALRRLEPHRAGRRDLAVARGLEAELLQLQGVALQNEVRLPAAQAQAAVGQGERGAAQRHGAGARHRRVLHIQREIGAQRARDTAHVVADCGRERRDVDRAGERDCRRQGRLALRDRGLALDAEIGGAARRHLGVERRLLADD